MTNVLFLTFYYGFIFPAGFFFAAATLAIHYWVDKFCLLRVWAPAPMLGSEIADMSRVYFMSFAIAVYAVMSSFNYASFPYDNACGTWLSFLRYSYRTTLLSANENILPFTLVDETTVSSEYVGTFEATTPSGNAVQVDVAKGDSNYFYCNQDMMHYSPPAFPAIPSNQPVGGEWMTPSQDFCNVFGWTALVIVVYVIGIFLNAFRKRIVPVFFRIYEVRKNDTIWATSWHLCSRLSYTRSLNENDSAIRQLLQTKPLVRFPVFLPTFLKFAFQAIYFQY